MTIRKLYRIFDHLYVSKDFAESLEDGKDVAKEVWAILSEFDNKWISDEYPLQASEGFIFHSEEEARHFVKEEEKASA